MGWRASISGSPYSPYVYKVCSMHRSERRSMAAGNQLLSLAAGMIVRSVGRPVVASPTRQHQPSLPCPGECCGYCCRAADATMGASRYLIHPSPTGYRLHLSLSSREGAGRPSPPSRHATAERSATLWVCDIRTGSSRYRLPLPAVKYPRAADNYGVLGWMPSRRAGPWPTQHRPRPRVAAGIQVKSRARADTTTACHIASRQTKPPEWPHGDVVFLAPAYKTFLAGVSCHSDIHSCSTHGFVPPQTGLVSMPGPWIRLGGGDLENPSSTMDCTCTGKASKSAYRQVRCQTALPLLQGQPGLLFHMVCTVCLFHR